MHIIHCIENIVKQNHVNEHFVCRVHIKQLIHVITIIAIQISEQ